MGGPHDTIDGSAPAIAACALAEHGLRGNSAAAFFTNDTSHMDGRLSPGPEPRQGGPNAGRPCPAVLPVEGSCERTIRKLSPPLLSHHSPLPGTVKRTARRSVRGGSAGGARSIRGMVNENWSHAPFLGSMDAPGTAAPRLAGPAGRGLA